MTLKLVDRNALLEELRGEESCDDPVYFILKACEGAGFPLEVREVEEEGDARFQVFSSGMTEQLKRECKVHRDHLIRGIWMRGALRYLAKRGVSYIPLDIEEDINKSYEEDDLGTFRGVVRGWIKELLRGDTA